MKRSTAPLHIDKRGVHLSIDDVPAWVCQQCGEPYFEESEVDSIEAIIQAVDRQAKKLESTG
jgi:YgiT-type zinc finger domain-containing protein